MLEDAALESVRQVIEALREAREREGARLVAILIERITRLRELATQAAPLVPAVVQALLAGLPWLDYDN